MANSLTIKIQHIFSARLFRGRRSCTVLFLKFSDLNFTKFEYDTCQSSALVTYFVFQLCCFFSKSERLKDDWDQKVLCHCDLTISNFRRFSPPWIWPEVSFNHYAAQWTSYSTAHRSAQSDNACELLIIQRNIPASPSRGETILYRVVLTAQS